MAKYTPHPVKMVHVEGKPYLCQEDLVAELKGVRDTYRKGDLAHQIAEVLIKLISTIKSE